MQQSDTFSIDLYYVLSAKNYSVCRHISLNGNITLCVGFRGNFWPTEDNANCRAIYYTVALYSNLCLYIIGTMLLLLWYRRSTPSPHSLSPHVHDEVDASRQRLSPSFQSGSLHRQRPLVPASEQQFKQQKLIKVFEQPADTSAVLSSVPPLVENNSSDGLLSRGTARQQYADGGQASLMRDDVYPPQQQQQSFVHSYQEQIISESRQLPGSMTSTSYSATQSEPSSLSSQLSNKSAGTKHVRVLDASGRDVQVHSTDGRQEQTSVQQPLQSQPQQTPATNAYGDLEDIMAEFDVCSTDFVILEY